MTISASPAYIIFQVACIVVGLIGFAMAVRAVHKADKCPEQTQRYKKSEMAGAAMLIAAFFVSHIGIGFKHFF